MWLSTSAQGEARFSSRLTLRRPRPATRLSQPHVDHVGLVPVAGPFVGQKALPGLNLVVRVQREDVQTQLVVLMDIGTLTLGLVR